MDKCKKYLFRWMNTYWNACSIHEHAFLFSDISAPNTEIERYYYILYQEDLKILNGLPMTN